MSNPTGAGGLKEHPEHINRKGRPKSFDQWRKLNIAILNEVAKDAHGDPIIIDGHIATNAEMIVRSKMKDAKHQTDVVEAAYGKVPQQVDVTSGGEKITPETMTPTQIAERVAALLAAKKPDES